MISRNFPFSGHCDQRIRLTFFWQTINQKPDISCAIGYPFCWFWREKNVLYHYLIDEKFEQGFSSLFTVCIRFSKVSCICSLQCTTPWGLVSLQMEKSSNLAKKVKKIVKYIVILMQWMVFFPIGHFIKNMIWHNRRIFAKYRIYKLMFFIKKNS